MWQLRGELRVEAEFLQLPVDLAARTFYKFGSMLIAVSMRFQCVQRFCQTLEPVLMVQQRTHLRMFAYDRPPIGWRVRNLPNRGDRMYVGHLICDRAKEWHQEHCNRAGCDQC